MTEAVNPPLYTLAADEKVAPIMLYTHTALVWGEAVLKKQIRGSTWLRTNAAPDSITLYNARVLIITAPTQTPRPLVYPEIHMAAEQVLACHLVPPEKDPPDYDPTEPNRRMDPVSIVVSTFRMDGFMRLAAMSTLNKYFEVTHEVFTPIYDAEIVNMLIPALGVMKVPFVLVRQKAGIFTTR